MRRALAPPTVLATLAALLVAASATPSGPRDLVAKTVDEVLAILKDPKLTPEARRERIVAIAYDRFDFPTMSKLVLAKYWKRFDAAQREEFMKEFKDFLAHRYGDRIDRYEQEKVEIVGERNAKGGDAIIETRIHRPRLTGTRQSDFMVALPQSFSAELRCSSTTPTPGRSRVTIPFAGVPQAPVCFSCCTRPPSKSSAHSVPQKANVPTSSMICCAIHDSVPLWNRTREPPTRSMLRELVLAISSSHRSP